MLISELIEDKKSSEKIAMIYNDRHYLTKFYTNNTYDVHNKSFYFYYIRHCKVKMKK